jgi:lipoyltransferase 1
MTSKADYNRSRNLNLICDALMKVLDVDVSVNKRDDIVIDGTKKVSGTAAKIARGSAYHHCTLLVNVDTSNLHKALNNPASAIIETNATKSVRSPVENLANKCEAVNIEEIESAIAHQFAGNRIVDIHPSDLVYEGLDEIEEGYQSWSWIYGKSPKFSLTSTNQKMSVVNGEASLDSISETYRFDSNLVGHLESTCNPELVGLAGLVKKIV